MLSNPSPESSVGKFLSARNSMARRSRIVFVYSARFNRRAVTRPGSGFIGGVGAGELGLEELHQGVDLVRRAAARPRAASPAT